MSSLENVVGDVGVLLNETVEMRFVFSLQNEDRLPQVREPWLVVRNLEECAVHIGLYIELIEPGRLVPQSGRSQFRDETAEPLNGVEPTHL